MTGLENKNTSVATRGNAQIKAYLFLERMVIDMNQLLLIVNSANDLNLITLINTNGIDGSDGLPELIDLIPTGEVKGKAGDFIVDKEAFDAMYKVFKDRKLDVPFDYEHQTLMDKQAPAAGWIKDLIWTDSMIKAKVEWTDKAKEYLKNKEYRYSSPVIQVDPKTRRAMELHSSALTNTPAIDNMPTLVNKAPANNAEPDDKDNNEPKGGNKMELSILIEMLGLEKDASEEDVKAAIAALKEKASKEIVANKTITGLLGLTQEAKTEEVVLEIMAMKNTQTSETPETLVVRAMEAGKVTVDMKDWALEYAETDPNGFKTFVNKQKSIVPMDKMSYKKEKKKSVTDLDENDLMVCKSMGIEPEEYIKMLGGNEDAR
jgi:phage I-like protein